MGATGGLWRGRQQNSGIAARQHGSGWGHALRRLLGRLFELQYRQLERDVGEFIARSGGSLTDNIEREMMQRITRLGNGTWR